MQASLLQVDSFTAKPFAGNPAGVCLVLEQASDEWMLNVAAEVNASETAFIRPVGRGFELRWFTPHVEVELCGHGTLAAAHVLYDRGLAPAEGTISFQTRFRGELLCARNERGWISMDFPADAFEEKSPPDALLPALRIDAAQVEAILRATYDWIVVLRDEAAVMNVSPDFAALGPIDARGIALTAPADDEDVDAASRFFGPHVGINEDPVTGSAHCAIGPYWCDRLGKPTVTCKQGQARQGVLRVTDHGERVDLAGQAVTVFEGVIV